MTYDWYLGEGQVGGGWRTGTPEPFRPQTKNYLAWLVKAIKNDSKRVWTIVFILGTTLGYNIPGDLSGIIPTPKYETLETLETRVDLLEQRISTLEGQPYKHPVTRERPIK